MQHVVFVDSTGSGLLALQAARRLNHRVTFIRPRTSSFLAMAGVPEARIAEALRSVDRLIEIEDADSDLEEAVAALNDDDPPDALLSTAETAIVPVARVAERFGLHYPPLKALSDAVNKDRCRQALSAAGLPSTPFEVISNPGEARKAARRIGFPLVIKPTRGFGKEASAVCWSAEDLDGHLASLPDVRGGMDGALNKFLGDHYVLEAYIHGELFSAELAVCNGRVAPLVITRRERASYNPLFEIAAIMPGGLPRPVEEQITEYMQAIFETLGLNVGIYHVEFILGSGGPVLVEINARMMGGISPQMYKAISGVDPFETLIRLHLGEKITVDRSLVRKHGIVIALGAPQGGRVPDDAAEKLAALFSRYDMFENTLRLQSGAEVQRFRSNITAFGHVGLLAPSDRDVRSVGLAFINDLETVLGFPIARYSDRPGMNS